MMMRMRLARVFGGLVAMLVTAGALGWPAQIAAADGAWLDGPLQNWNKPGQEVPAPPRAVNRAELDPRCLETARPAESAEDAQIEKQGWLLVGMYYSGWDARVIVAASDFDGMCRPLGFQAFVFSSETFAGTLSPVAMDSRTDGTMGSVYLRGSISPQSSVEINADFARYKDSDPLCCPSATSSVSYQLVQEGGKPLVKPAQAYTNPSSRN